MIKIPGILAIASFIIMWTAAVTVVSAATPPDTHAGVEQIGPDTLIPLGVFAVALISTIGFTWAVANFYGRLARDHERITALETKLKAIEDKA